MNRICHLRSEIMTYAWGSRRHIAELQGRSAPTPGPEAELWLGAHPKAPSRVLLGDDEIALDQLIAADPGAILGADVAARFDGQLPFLFKVLAAAEPLSIQAHPSRAQAVEGFAREEAAGLPRDAPNRSFRDAMHKPELICALTPFWAMCGFRPVEEVRQAIEELQLAGFDDLLAPLRAADRPSALGGFLAALLSLSRERQAGLASAAAAQVQRAAAADPASAWVARLAEHYPEDAGVLAPLFLNLFQLQPGEALFLGPGMLHAYLEGCGLEIMANSDNVLRGGLTPKHIDVDGLLAALSLGDEAAPQVLHPRVGVPGEEIYSAPAAEFRLARITLAGEARHASGARDSVEILLGLEGEAAVRPLAGGDAVTLEPGRALLLPAAAGAYEISGPVTLFRADVPPA